MSLRAGRSHARLQRHIFHDAPVRRVRARAGTASNSRHTMVDVDQSTNPEASWMRVVAPTSAAAGGAAKALAAAAPRRLGRQMGRGARNAANCKDVDMYLHTHATKRVASAERSSR